MSLRDIFLKNNLQSTIYDGFQLSADSNQTIILGLVLLWFEIAWWGCADGTLGPLAYTRASSAENFATLH